MFCHGFLFFVGDLASKGKLHALVISSYHILPYYRDDLRSKHIKNSVSYSALSKDSFKNNK